MRRQNERKDKGERGRRSVDEDKATPRTNGTKTIDKKYTIGNNVRQCLCSFFLFVCLCACDWLRVLVFYFFYFSFLSIFFVFDMIPWHFMPWWMTPQRRLPQWSQKVGLLQVCCLNWCFVRVSCVITPLHRAHTRRLSGYRRGEGE